MRSAEISGDTLSLSADFNATTSVEVIGAPRSVSKLKINGRGVETTRGVAGTIRATVEYIAPKFELPDLESVEWKWADSLPEIKAGYDDSKWPIADHETTNNKFGLQRTPTVLFASEYGFHVGHLVYRGHFTARGNESTLELGAAGGDAFGYSVWLDDTYLGSWHGTPSDEFIDQSHALPKLEEGKEYVLTVVVDNQGQNMNHIVGDDTMRSPRGLTYWRLGGTQITWRLTGNLDGEDYHDTARGPINEGGSYAERQGWHLPSPPSRDWAKGNPVKDELGPGIRLYTTQFSLDMPRGWDVPLEIAFDRPEGGADFRLQLFVNGWQFGKMLSRYGAQTSFPVPEGIFNYNGENTIAIIYWSQEDSVKSTGIAGISLRAKRPVLTGRPEVKSVNAPSWKKRPGAY